MKPTLLHLLKYSFFICLLALSTVPVKAQYVTIPDTIFVSWLNHHGYTACLNGNQLDTTCNAVLTADSMKCYGVPIKDLTGIQYFHHLTFLDCSSDSLIYIPALPDSLGFFNCSFNYLDSLPALPDSLTYLYCSYNSLDTLANLPAGLKFLDCSVNNISALPPLPQGLISLSCTDNFLDTLPALPLTLDTLNCSQDALTSLPILPDSIRYLACSINSIRALPVLPSNLQGLFCSENEISLLPALPAGLTQLDCGMNSGLTSLPALPPALNLLHCANCAIAVLPALPNALRDLDCGANNLSVLPALPPDLWRLVCDFNRAITTLPPLPAGLWDIECYNDSIIVLPPLPANLQQMDCSANFLTALPSLPPFLNSLICQFNKLDSLPALPQSLTDLECGYNSLLSLPVLPDSMYRLDCSWNPQLTCLPQLKTIYYLDFDSTAITCLPDYGNVYYPIPRFSSFPLCGIFNAGACGVFWNISGQTYNDANSNCTFDSTEVGATGVKLILDSAGVLQQQVYSVAQGFYSFETANGNYTVRVDTANLPFTVLCPANNLLAANVSTLNPLLYNNDFAFKCRAGGFDLGVQSILNDYTIPRPDAVFTLNTIAGDMSQVYGANCAAGISGQVSLIFSGPVSYIAPATGALTPTVNGDTLTYNIADFGTINNKTAFNASFQVNWNAAAGADICFTVSLTPAIGDYNPSNNTATYCFPVKNALDPNEKEVYPASVDSAGQWLTYTIRFQNTGTAPAVNIIVKDTLNASLDPSSFQLLAYSAKNLTQVFGNVVIFNFPDINLVDKTTSDILSRGYVQYRIKTSSTLQQDAVITNSASIYFDFNSPVVTNTVTDTVSGALAIQPSCSPNASSMSQNICLGDTIHMHNKAYYMEGSYTDTLQNAGGCDSVVTLTLAVRTSPAVSLSWDAMVQLGNLSAVAAGDTVLCAGSHASIPLTGGLPLGGIYAGVFVEHDTLTLVENALPYADTIYYVYLDTNQCLTMTANTIDVEICTGVQSITAMADFTIYPNPTSNLLYIQTESLHPQTITIYDISGQQVSQQPFAPEIDIHNLSPGVYLLEVTATEGIARKRWVKM